MLRRSHRPLLNSIPEHVLWDHDVRVRDLTVVAIHALPKRVVAATEEWHLCVPRSLPGAIVRSGRGESGGARADLTRVRLLPNGG